MKRMTGAPDLDRPSSATRFSPRAPRFWVLMAVLALAFTVGHAFIHVAAVDSCLDDGGVYNYVDERCECARSQHPGAEQEPQCKTLTSRPVIPYSQRHGSLAGVGLTSTGLALAIAAVTRFRVRRRS